MRELELVGRCRSLPPICQWLEAKKAMSVTHRDNSVEIVADMGIFVAGSPTPCASCTATASSIEMSSVPVGSVQADAIANNSNDTSVNTRSFDMPPV